MTSPASSSPDAAPPAIPPQPPAPPPLPISGDLFCMQCHYNLRTRSTADRCPECGLPIAETLAHLRQSAGLIADERALNAGARLLGWTSLAAAPLYAYQALIESPLAGSFPPAAFLGLHLAVQSLEHAMFLGALIIGVMLISASFSTRIISAGARSFLLLVSMLYAFLNAPGTLLTLVMALESRRFGRWGRPAMVITRDRIGVAIVTLVLLSAGYLCFRRLARATASSALLRNTHIAFLPMLGQAILPLLVMSFVGNNRPRIGMVVSNPASLFPMDFFSALSNAVFAWFWFSLMGILRKQTPASSLPDSRIAATPSVPERSPGDKVHDFLSPRRP